MNTLNRLETVSGDYGLYIKVKYTDEINTTASQEKTFNFSQNDMYGDVYNFTTYFSQEAVFNISDVGNITSIEAFLYQGSNFKRIKSSGDGKDNYELIPNKIIEKNTINGNDYISEAKMEPNIFVNNIKISLGYDLNNFDNDTVIVYTLNSTQYSSSDNSTSRKREIRARWVHKTDDEFVSVPITDLTKYNANIHWYHYVLDEKVTGNQFGGKYWAPITTTDTTKEQYLDGNDAYKCYIVCDPAIQDENVKAVISIPSAEKLAYIKELKDYFKNDRNLFTEDDVNLIIDALEKYEVIDGDNKVTEALTNLRNKITDKDENGEKNSQKADQVEYLDKVINKINEMKENLSPYDLYSDVAQIHNTTQVQARLAVDLVQAVSITVGDEKDPYKGVYMIYGENGEIMNSSISAQRQKLVLSYGSLLTGLNEFDGDGTELVSWRFPLTNTMIRTPTEGIEYDNSQAIIYNEKGEPLKNKDGSYQIRTNRDGVPIIQHNGDDYPIIQYIDDTGATTNQNNATWAVIKRKIEKLKETNKNDETKIGDFATKTTEQIFRIKDYYTSVGRNTIYCEINKGGYIYVAEITLIFGVAGTSGTDYTLRIVPSETTIDKKINLNAHVYDYNNQEVEIKSITYSFVSPNSLNNVLTEVPEDFPVKFGTKSGSAVDIEINGNSISTDKYYVIVKASAQIEILDTYLTTFLPLSWSSNLSNYNHFEGPDKVIYNAQGSNPFYYKNNFVLYNQLDKEVSDITWTLEAYDTELYDTSGKETTAKKFYPSVLLTKVGEDDDLNQKIYYSLKVPSMYIKENSLCRLVGKKKNDIVWIQPLYIAQNAYNSPLLNAWDETVSIDEEGGTIMAPMIGAGKKNTDNQFSGVLMGDVKAKADNSVALTGLYGYQNGIQTFSLTEEGKAKFGTSGSGQIQIDGSQGIIESGNYTVDKKTGMQIDLKEGHIDAYNFKLTSNYITINSTEDTNNYFTIKGTGDVDTITYSYNYGSKGNTLSTTITPTTVTQTLFNVGNSSYYLQTLDYNDRTNQEAGMRWDLATGKLRAYSGFNLEAINHKVKVNETGQDAEQLNDPPIYVEIKNVDNSSTGYKNNSNYIFDKVKTYNYKQYYFKLSGDETNTYYNNWEIFETAPFKYTYEVVKDSDGNDRRTTNNYTGVFDNYYFGYKDDKAKIPWDGTEGIEVITNYRKITKDNWQAKTPYFKAENILGLDTTIQSKDETTILSLWKKVDTKKYNLIGSKDANLNVGVITCSDNKDYTISQNPNRDVEKEGKLSFAITTKIGDNKEQTNPIKCWYWNEKINDFTEITSIDTENSTNDVLKFTLEGLSTIPNVYTTAGSYYKGTLSINADAGQYPIQLKLGNDETPFKLSWAGYLFTTKLQATGGTIGNWYIDPNGLWSDKSSPKIQINKTGTISISIPNNEAYTLTSSNKDYTGPHILVGGRNGKFIDKVYDSIGSGELTKHEEGKFDNEDIGKYIQKNGSYYKIMRTTLDNIGSYYEQVYKGEGGIALTGDGTIAIENLFLKGGGGYWGGCAAYSTATTSTGHTHNLSGNIPSAIITNSNFRYVDWYNKETGELALSSLQSSQISASGSYKGDSKNGLTFNISIDYDIDTGSQAFYYSRSAYNSATKKYYTSKKINLTAADRKLGYKWVFAYRTDKNSLGITTTKPSGTPVSNSG